MKSAPSADAHLNENLAVSLDNVTVRYQPETAALNGVSLRIERGERVGLVGSSGAGKSTLINLLNGRVILDGATVSGQVEVLGVSPSSLNSREHRRHGSMVGTVRQALDLVGPMQVIHNINAGRLGTWSTSRALWSLWRPRHLQDAAASLERVGLDPALVSSRVDKLSGGQQQRVAVARLLIQDPDLLLADEPLSSLDPALSKQVIKLLTEVAKERSRTLLVSLHQPEFASRFLDRLVGLRDGQIVFDEPAAVIEDGDLAALYRQ